MKKLIISILLSLLTQWALAQTNDNNPSAHDVIIKVDGSELEVKITEITETTIKYKNANHLDGPTRNMGIAEVFLVIYANGDREFFTRRPDPSTTQATLSTPPSYTPAKTGSKSPEPVVRKSEPEQPKSASYKKKSDLYPVGFSMTVGSGLGNGHYGLGMRYVGNSGDGIKANAGLYGTSSDIYFTYSVSYLGYWDFAKGFYSEISFGSMGVDEFIGIYSDGFGDYNFYLESSRRWGAYAGIGYELFGDVLGVNASILSGYSWGDSYYSESFWDWQYELGVSVRF